MACARQLLHAVVLFIGSCGSYEDATVDDGDGGQATAGWDASGGAPAVAEGDCEIVTDPQSLQEVMLPHDECGGQPDIALPSSTGDCVFWTGQGYLTATSDSRGVVVTALDSDGVIVSEEILTAQSVSRLKSRLSRNGEHVLIVLDLGTEQSVAAAVLDLQGVPVTQLNQLAAENYPQRFNFAVTPSEDSWLVAFGYNDPSFGSRGILVSRVSSDGVLDKQYDIKVWGYVSLNGFVSNEGGASILDGEYDSGGQYGGQYKLVAQIDHDLEAVSCTAAELD